MTLTFLFTLLSVPLFADESLSAQIEKLQLQSPVEYERRAELQPRATRAGHLRFVGSELTDPTWAPLYLERYLNGDENTEVRRALLHLVYRSLEQIPTDVENQYTEEPAILRADILANSDNSLLTEQGLKDPSPLVRAALARKAGISEEISTAVIVHLLQDQDDTVKMDAARASYRRDCMDAIPLLIPLSVQQENGTLALRSLYALSKINTEQAVAIVKKHQLAQSSHHNLAIFAANLLKVQQ